MIFSKEKSEMGTYEKQTSLKSKQLPKETFYDYIKMNLGNVLS